MHVELQQEEERVEKVGKKLGYLSQAGTIPVGGHADSLKLAHQHCSKASLEAELNWGAAVRVGNLR